MSQNRTKPHVAKMQHFTSEAMRYTHGKMNEMAVFFSAELGRALNTVFKPPPALLAYVVDHPASPGLLAKAKTAGLPNSCAELACAVMTRVIECLDQAAQMRRGSGYARAKLIETALSACRPPVGDALRVAMVACPIDGKALLRLWNEVADHSERGAMLDMLRNSLARS